MPPALSVSKTLAPGALVGILPHPVVATGRSIGVADGKGADGTELQPPRPRAQQKKTLHKHL